jgi:hypothetical protein
MTPSEDVRSRWTLGGVAALAMAWAFIRAAVQSITIDEANSYVQFASRHLYLWYAANNHILNSTLMYGFTRLLGPSQFTARLPALLGAAFYITAAYRLCRLLGASVPVQLTVFVCLVFNPFIFDYLVAARGYSLALGFLMWALVFFAESYLQGGPLLTACVVSSACAGMSVSANFSFAFVNLSAMLAILLSACYQRPKEKIRLLAACALPGTIIVAIVCGYALLHRHPGELIYGASTWGETFGTVIEASLFKSPFNFLGRLVFPLVAITGVVWLLSAVIRMPPLGWVVGAIFAATAAIHWVAFLKFGLLLPKDRTAIYFFPLFMIVAGVLAATPAASRLGRYLRASFVGSLAFMAIYFLTCLRLTYFKEWYWDADVQKTYQILSCLNREHQVTRVVSSWSYRGPLNFYRLAQPNSIQEITETGPSEAQIYVKDTVHDAEGNPLFDRIFYKSPTTDLVLEAPSAEAAAYAAGTCLRL